MRLIFLNGWSASAALLGELPGRLCAKQELIVLDHLYQDSPEEISCKIEALLTEDTVLMGWSLGGLLAMQYLLAQPVEALRPLALILLQATPCFLQKADWPVGVSEEHFDALAEVTDSRNSLKLIRVFSQLMVAGSAWPKEEKNKIKAVYRPEDLPDWPALSNGLDYLKELDLREYISRLQLPVLGIYGQNDVLVKSEVIEFMARQCINFKGELFSQMGHFPFGHQVEKVAQCINEFLASEDLSIAR
jgi:pimeloyl-[acyl-carrier protein] methyl ester esterase